MNNDIFIKQIYEINYRRDAEISLIKKISLKSQTEKEKGTFYRMGIVLIYGLLEGYIKSILSEAIKYIESKDIPINNISLPILTTIYKRIYLETSQTLQYGGEKKLIKKVKKAHDIIMGNFNSNCISSDDIIGGKLSDIKNINKLGLSIDSINDILGDVHFLSLVRNAIAHGDLLVADTESFTKSIEIYYKVIDFLYDNLRAYLLSEMYLKDNI